MCVFKKLCWLLGCGKVSSIGEITIRSHSRPTTRVRFDKLGLIYTSKSILVFYNNYEHIWYYYRDTVIILFENYFVCTSVFNETMRESVEISP